LIRSSGIFTTSTLGEKKANVKCRFSYAVHQLVLFLFSLVCCHRDAMTNRVPRSAGVTAAATLAILGCATAFFVWGHFFLAVLNAPPDVRGKHLYQTHTVAFLLIAIVPAGLIALGIRTGIGLFQLRSWARVAALIWASIALVFCLAMIAFRPFETFFIPDHFVSQVESLKQLLAISFFFLLFPASVWWLFLFRSKSVKMQFGAADAGSPLREPATAVKN